MTHTILIADDDPLLTGLVRLKLGRMGFSVVEVSDGAELLSRIDDVQPDIIILDLRMPNMDGKTTLTELKASDRYSHIPVIMLSATKTSFTEAAALDKGASYYLTKPFNPEVLVDYVHRALAGGRQRRGAVPGFTY